MPRALNVDAHRYQALQRALAQLPPFRRGSLVRRFMPCGKPGCRCQAHPPQLHGPYYQWTRKIAGKTVTARVNAAQATLLAEWIQNARRLDQIVSAMERVGYRLTERRLRAARTPAAPPERSQAGNPARTATPTSRAPPLK